jgi:hypothetical protein
VIQLAALNTKDLNPEESAPFQQHNHSILPAQSINIQNGVIQTSTVQTAAYIHPICNLSKDDGNLYSRLPQFPAIGNCQSKQKVDRIIAQPAKFQLFKRLKAIIEPNNQQPKEVENISFSQIVEFKLPLDNVSGE